jgi:hypothetical protein
MALNSGGGKAMRARSHVPGRQGNHHGRALPATAAIALLLAAGPAPAQVAPQVETMPQAPAEQANPFRQRGVPAEATAENGVIARERALAAAQRAAWERLAAELGAPPRNLSQSQIESMVDSIVIEQERTRPTGYSGRVTVVFNPNRVRSVTGAGAGAVAGVEGLPGAAAPARGPAVATVEAVARYASLGEWLELRRRLAAAPEVARLDIVAIAVDAARLRLGLRAAPPVAAEGLAAAGVAMGQGGGPTGEGWRVGLAGGY